MNKIQILSEAIKDVLVNMASEDSLPLDMTTLDIKLISEKLEETVEHDLEYQRVVAIEKLANYISEDDVENSLKLLLEQSEKDGDVMADDVVLMWEPLTNYFTVNKLLEEIGF